MKKLIYAVMLLLGLSMMFSCGQQRSKNNNATENQTIKSEIVSDGNDDRATEESSIPEVTSVDNDYKWLEGVWAAEDEESHESVKMIITDTYFQFNRGFTDAMNDRVEEQPKIVYSIETRYNVILEKEILSFDEDYDNIGVDVERRCPYVILGEFSPILYLKKIEGQTTEDAIAKANQLKAQTIHGITITDPASYTWVDENLYGKVQSYTEEGKKEGTSTGYCVTKKFDNNGRIVYYKSDESSACGIYPFNMDNWLQILPMEDKINYTGSQLSYFMLDHNLMNPVHMVCYKPSDSPGGVDRYTHFNGEATYKYNMLGQISDLYINNKTHYEFEYDIEGRVTKALMNGKPTFKISWSYYGDYQHLGYSIKFYSQEGYDAGEFKYAWKSNDVLATVHNTGKKEEFSLPEFTFYEYPQVKTVVYGRGRSINCYFYNDKGRLAQVIKPTSESVLDYSENRPEDFFMCNYTSYQYNEKGDVVSRSNSEMLFKKKNMNNMSNSEFINYLFRNNFDELLNRSYKNTPLSNSAPSETIWRYEYDDHGNWTKRERYEVVHGDIDIENLKDITTRKYVYYE